LAARQASDETKGCANPKNQPTPSYLPIFRCFDLAEKGMNVLALADKLLEDLTPHKVLTAFYLSTRNHDYQEIYE
jgi:hypothetical protein